MSGEEARKTIEGFKKLKKGWDGYGAKTIFPIAIKYALEFITDIEETEGIKSFTVCPCGNGSITITLVFNDVKLDLNIGEK